MCPKERKGVRSRMFERVPFQGTSGLAKRIRTTHPKAYARVHVVGARCARCARCDQPGACPFHISVHDWLDAEVKRAVKPCLEIVRHSWIRSERRYQERNTSSGIESSGLIDVNRPGDQFEGLQSVLHTKLQNKLQFQAQPLPQFKTCSCCPGLLPPWHRGVPPKPPNRLLLGTKTKPKICNSYSNP